METGTGDQGADWWSAPQAARSSSWALLRRRPLVTGGGALLMLSAVLHLLALFPNFFRGQPALGAQPEQAALVAVVAAGWTGAALLVLLASGRSARSGVALAFGLAGGEVGFRLVDLGAVIHLGLDRSGTGLWLLAAGWIIGAGGVVVAATGVGRGESLGRPGGAVPLLVVATGMASVLTAIAFLPSWDRYRAVSGTTGQAVHFTAGNAFSNPAPVIAGNVVAAVMIAVIPILAAWWRPGGVGSAMIIGLSVAVGSQVVSALVQAGQPVPPRVFGVSVAVADRLALRAHLALTGWFDATVVGLFFLLVLAAVRGVWPDRPQRSPAAPGPAAARGVEPSPWDTGRG